MSKTPRRDTLFSTLEEHLRVSNAVMTVNCASSTGGEGWRESRPKAQVPSLKGGADSASLSTVQTEGAGEPKL